MSVRMRIAIAVFAMMAVLLASSVFLWTSISAEDRDIARARDSAERVGRHSLALAVPIEDIQRDIVQIRK